MNFAEKCGKVKQSKNQLFRHKDNIRKRLKVKTNLNLKNQRDKKIENSFYRYQKAKKKLKILMEKRSVKVCKGSKRVDRKNKK